MKLGAVKMQWEFETSYTTCSNVFLFPCLHWKEQIGLKVEDLNLEGDICQIAHSGSLPWWRRWDFAENTSLALLMFRTEKAADLEECQCFQPFLRLLKCMGLSDGESFISTLHFSMIAQQSLSVVRQFIDKSNSSLCFYSSSVRSLPLDRQWRQSGFHIFDEKTTYVAKNIIILKLRIFNISNLFDIVSPLWGPVVDKWSKILPS